MPRLKGNKGEWSEIYVFLSLLGNGRLYAADEDLHVMDNVFYEIREIIREEAGAKLGFSIDREKGKVVIRDIAEKENEAGALREEERDPLSVISMSDCRRAAESLYLRIKSAGGSSFASEETEAFLDKAGVHTLKAKSSDKADIRMRLHDISTGFEAVQGFSIKSRLGSPSTLINSGRTTNFIYEVRGPVDDKLMTDFNELPGKFREKFRLLSDHGCGIRYVDMANETFKGNLILIDGALPEISAALLEEYFRDGCSLISEATERIAKANPLHYNMSSGHPFYSYKVKKLLTECALGMLPSKIWTGTADATGGYIIVREDGEVLCYHLSNRNDFENYLLKNTKFDTASTGRHDFGYIYKENGRYLIRLNLQVRFIK